MKPASPEMLTLLSSRQFFSADLFTITLTNGGILRYTSGDQDIVANGVSYSAGGVTGPYWDRKDNKAKAHWKIGTSVDTMVVDVMPGSSTIQGDAFLDAVRSGIFDGAEFMIERAIMPTYGDTRVGVIRIFVGRVAEADMGRSVVTFSVNSHMEFFNLQFPRNICQTTCMNNLGDSICGVNLNSYSLTGTVVGSSSRGGFTGNLSGIPAPTDALTLGTVKFTSGTLNGLKFTLASGPAAGGVLVATMVGPMPVAPSLGDTFIAYYGCNKSLTDGNGCPKFSNQSHFRGFPFVPQPVLAV